MPDDTQQSMIVVGERLARIETKIDMVLDVTGDHEVRIRSLEHGHEMLARAQASPLRAYLPTISMATAVISMIVVLWSMFHHH